MAREIIYREANETDACKLSILFKTVYIQTYGRDGVSDEFAHFVIEQFAVERLLHSIETNPGALLVAVYKDNLVGVAEVKFGRSCPCRNIVAPELNKLYILERFCGLGIGSQLLNEAEQSLRSKGIKEMWLWVLATNQRAIAFYERKNFDWIGNAPFKMETNSYDNKVMLKQFLDERPTSAAPFASTLV